MVKRNYIRDDFDSIVGHLVEECGEVLAAAGKMLRWGPDSYNPELPKAERETNLAWLKREILDLESVIIRAKEHIFDEEEQCQISPTSKPSAPKSTKRGSNRSSKLA